MFRVARPCFWATSAAYFATEPVGELDSHATTLGELDPHASTLGELDPPATTLGELDSRATTVGELDSHATTVGELDSRKVNVPSPIRTTKSLVGSAFFKALSSSSWV